MFMPYRFLPSLFLEKDKKKNERKEERKGVEEEESMDEEYIP